MILYYPRLYFDALIRAENVREITNMAPFSPIEFKISARVEMIRSRKISVGCNKIFCWANVVNIFCNRTYDNCPVSPVHTLF